MNAEDALNSSENSVTPTSETATPACKSEPGYDCTKPKWYTYNEYRAIGRYIKDNNWVLDSLSLGWKMELAGLGPQARFGDNTTPEPSWWLLVDRIKWNAWNSKRGMSQEVAMEQFMDILLVNGIIDMIPKEKWVGAGPPDQVQSVYSGTTLKKSFEHKILAPL